MTLSRKVPSSSPSPQLQPQQLQEQAADSAQEALRTTCCRSCWDKASRSRGAPRLQAPMPGGPDEEGWRSCPLPEHEGPAAPSPAPFLPLTWAAPRGQQLPGGARCRRHARTRPENGGRGKPRSDPWRAPGGGGCASKRKITQKKALESWWNAFFW